MSMAYKLAKLISKAATNTFFRDITVIGEENIPEDCPLIIYGNHNNQFLDGLLIVSNVSRQVKFIVAAKSMKKHIIGGMASMLGGIPVERPQDIAKPGQGFIVSINKNQLVGQGTNFLSYQVQDSVTFDNHELVITQIISDTEIQFNSENPVEPKEFMNKPYKVLPKINQSQLFLEVWKSLNQDECIGIFPEGGSHDQTEVLPLKPGICIMTMGAVQAYNKPVYLVPCGFNYFKGYRFRSKVTISFGQAYRVGPEMIKSYQNNKRGSITDMLKELERRLRQVIITAPSYSDLCSILLLRRIYFPQLLRLSPKEVLDNNHLFAESIKQHRNDPQVEQILIEVKDYRQMLKGLGIEDFQVRHFRRNTIYSMASILQSFIMTGACLTFALPGILMNGPLALILRTYSENERRKALAGSKVKVLGKDVVASFKVLASAIILPSSVVLYTILFYLSIRKRQFAQGQRSKLYTILFLFLWPIYVSLMIRSTDGLLRHAKNVKAKIYFLFFDNQFQMIKGQRATLQQKIRKMIQGLNIIDEDQSRKYFRYDSFNTKISQAFDSLSDFGI